jgi:alkaline phosphatase D
MRIRRPQPIRSSLSRRHFLARGSLLAGAALTGAGVARRSLAQATAPAIVTSDRMRPQMPSGVQSGDVTAERGIVWSRTDRPARLIVE